MSWEQQPSWQQPGPYAVVDPPMVAPVVAPPRRAWGGLVLGAMLLVIGAMLALTAQVRPLQGVRSTVTRLHELLVAGDLVTLRAEAPLGAKRWADSVVREFGQAEYDRVMAIYARAEQEGSSEFSRLQNAVTAGGQQAYDNLGPDQRRAVDRRSHDEWVLPEGYRLTPEAASVGTLAVVMAPTVDPALVQRLGTAALSDGERAQLADRPDADPAVQGDRGLSRIAQKRNQRGTRALAQVQQRIVTAGERSFRRLDRSTRGVIDRRSHWEFLNQQGMASLSAEDRARVGDPAVFGDDVLASALRQRLGIERLPPAERREVEGRPRDAFVAQHDVYVEREGLRLGRAAVGARYRRSRYELHDVRVSGQGSRDLIRRRRAHATLRWTASGDGTLRLLHAVALEWDGPENRWRVGGLEWEPDPARTNGGESAEDPS